MKHILNQCPVVAILRNLPEDLLIPYAESILRGGISVFEVAMNTPDGAGQISALKEHFKESVTVGAGTATTIERIDSALQAGAQFFLTPSVDESILRYFRKKDLDLLPGVMTPSDVALCIKYNYRIMKLFPAGDLPLSYIKSLKGPFEDTDYVAVGGVRGDNLHTFFEHGFIGAGLGSSLIPHHFLEERDWQGASRYISGHYGAFLPS